MAMLFAVSLVLLPFSKKDEPSADGSVIAAQADVMAAQTSTGTAAQLFGEGTEKFIAHRGYSGYAPENSIPAFELAGRTGFWGIETDISETSDGHFVCMHDEDLDRTTDGTGAIGNYTLEELGNFHIDKGNYLKTTENLKIPTLEEFIEICSRYDCVAMIEIKKIQNYDALMSIIVDSGIIDRCIITGGEVNDITEIRTRNPYIPVMLIGYYPSPYTDNLAAIKDIEGEKGILSNFPQVDENAVSTLHSRGVYCGVWTVDEEDVARDYLGYGVDFIVTNEIPARLEYMINENE